jgi:glutaconate CoA-transferase subunit B
MRLQYFHPGVTVETIKENTGFELDVANAKETPPPTEEELRLIRQRIDPEGIWLKAMITGTPTSLTE